MKIELFEANEKRGYNFPFILILPDKFQNVVKIFVEGNNSVDYEKAGQQDFSIQKQAALNYAKNLILPQDGKYFNMPYLFQQLRQPLLIPIIERCDNLHKNEFYTQMLGKNVLSEKDGKFAHLPEQVVNMTRYIKDVLRQKGLFVENKSGLLGMSTSGVFAGRMLFASPENFDTCISICSNAVQPLPLSKLNGVELPYPLGTADYEEKFGKPFNENEYRKARQLFIVGEEEPNDKYDIVKNPRLHDQQTRDLYLKVFGDVGLQNRQQKMADIFRYNNFENVECIVEKGGHSLENKGNLIMQAIRLQNMQSDSMCEKS